MPLSHHQYHLASEMGPNGSANGAFFESEPRRCSSVSRAAGARDEKRARPSLSSSACSLRLNGRTRGRTKASSTFPSVPPSLRLFVRLFFSFPFFLSFFLSEISCTHNERTNEGATERRSHRRRRRTARRKTSAAAARSEKRRAGDDPTRERASERAC